MRRCAQCACQAGTQVGRSSFKPFFKLLRFLCFLLVFPCFFLVFVFFLLSWSRGEKLMRMPSGSWHSDQWRWLPKHCFCLLRVFCVFFCFLFPVFSSVFFFFACVGRGEDVHAKWERAVTSGCGCQIIDGADLFADSQFLGRLINKTCTRLACLACLLAC